MDQENKLAYVENYLKKYFDEMFINDIKMIKNKDLQFTFPYILLVSSGIDFLGGLEKGFKGENVGNRFRGFIENWMVKINKLYGDKRISEIIYNPARCGSSHQAIYKKEIESSSWLYPKDKHLHHMVDLEGKDRIFLHALQFVEDFLEAQDLFRKQYISKNIHNVYKNLFDMLQEPEISGFSDLIKYLKSKGKTFEAEKAIQKNPKIKEYNKKTVRIKSINESECIPSAAPIEETSTTTSTTSTSTSISKSTDRDISYTHPPEP